MNNIFVNLPCFLQLFIHLFTLEIKITQIKRIYIYIYCINDNNIYIYTYTQDICELYTYQKKKYRKKYF